MSSINYPSKETSETLETVNSSSLKLKLVKLKTIRNKRNLLHSFLNSVCKEYQNETDEIKKIKIASVFSSQISNYIISDSKEHKNIIYNKLKKISLNSEFKDKFSINLINSDKHIFNAVIVKKDYEDDFVDLNIAYKLFSKKTLETFSPTSRVFTLLNEKLIIEMLNQRFINKNYEEKIKNMKKELDQNENLRAKIEKLSEIIEYNNNEKNNIDPINFLKGLEEKELINENLLHLFSCIFNLNIFICRMWNNDLTVINEINYSEDSHSIILFKYSGKISLTGIDTTIFYETGGIEIDGKIITILNYKDHKKIIKKLRREISSGKEKFLMEKYNNYLDNLEKTEHLDKMETNYDNRIVGNDSELIELENTDHDLMELENDETTSKLSKKIEIIKNRIEKNENNYSVKKVILTNNVENSYDDPDIPYFIKDFSDQELEDLYHRFINPETDLNNISRINLEIQYKNFIYQNQEDISSIIQNLKEKTV